MPQMAFLSSVHKKAFESEIVEYKQANLINEGMPCQSPSF